MEKFFLPARYGRLWKIYLIISWVVFMYIGSVWITDWSGDDSSLVILLGQALAFFLWIAWNTFLKFVWNRLQRFRVKRFGKNE